MKNNYTKNGELNWDALSEELYNWANDATDLTEWPWVSDDRKNLLSEAARAEAEEIYDTIKDA